MNDKIRTGIIEKEILMCNRFIKIASIMKEIITKFDGKIIDDTFRDIIDATLNQGCKPFKRTYYVSIGYGHLNNFVVTIFCEDAYVEIKRREDGHSECCLIKNTLYDYTFPRYILKETKEQNYKINAREMNEHLDTTIIPILKNKLEYWEEQLNKIYISFEL